MRYIGVVYRRNAYRHTNSFSKRKQKVKDESSAVIFSIWNVFIALAATSSGKKLQIYCYF